jgi:hypothetical protein
MMRVIAASISDPATERHTLEMVVCLARNGRLDPAFQDSVPQRCRMVRDGREEWSGRLRMDEDRWIVHSDLGDDEPIWILHSSSLRPGEHLILCGLGGKRISFRVQHVSRAREPSAKLHLVRNGDGRASFSVAWRTPPQDRK